MTTKKIAIIGGGSWATGIAKLVMDNHHHINWYIYEKEIIDHIKKHKHNPSYLSTIEFDPKKITFFNNVKEAVESSQVVIVVVPSTYIKHLFEKEKIDFTNIFIINASKGIIPGDNISVTEYFRKKFHIPENNVGLISGPSHAEEIAMERMTYLTCAAKNDKDAEKISGLIKQWYVKTVISIDVIGIEYGAVMKNIYALAAGIAHGLGYGDNFTAVMVANAIREMERFLAVIFHHDRHLFHSAYLGDLLVTAYSQFSRNRTFGNMIGKGYSVKAAILEMNQVAEGYFGTKCIYEINQKHNARIPIVDAVYNILYKNSSATKEFNQLSDILK
jgi:glycerol-3-phosphate dehydrogenase (NAD(P)+)